VQKRFSQCGRKDNVLLQIEKALFLTCSLSDSVTVVGASLLAMVVNDNASNQIPSGVVAFFASKLAPTGLQESRIPGFQDSWIPGSPTFDRSLPPDETLG
jgi:hypothetical protein